MQRLRAILLKYNICKDLTPAESAKINAYLAAKWGLSADLDSDNDGFTDAVEIAAGSNPSDATSLAITYPDFSDAVDAEIGSASGLDSIEGSLALWLDAANINGTNNVGLTDNYR